MKHVVLDGRRYLWRDVLIARREQKKEQRQLAQPPLFELHIDFRPPGERTAAERFREPTLFDRR